MEKKVISVDFDNTLFTEVYPGIGEPINGAREVLEELHDNGHTIIINTCREGSHAEVAIQALNAHGFKWDYMNINDPERVEKYGNDSRKIGSDIVIDDKCALSLSEGKVVDWDRIKRALYDILLPKRLLVCIVGESGSGKTHLAEYLKSDKGIPMIESYTDRPKRTEGEVGHTFLTPEEFDNLDMRDMIAYTSWVQEDGSIGRYCCLDSDVTHNVHTYVIDERGLVYLRKYWSNKFRIFAVRMYSSEHLRIERVGEERAQRDKGKFNLTHRYFDYFIDNNYSDGMIKKYESLYKQIENIL